MSDPLSSRAVRAHALDDVDALRDRLAAGGVADDDADVRALKARVVLNAMFQFTGLAALDGTLLEANQTALDAGGIERDEVVGRPVWEAHWFTVDAETQEQLREAIAHAGRTGTLVRYDVDVYASAEGTTIVPIDFSARPVLGSDGEVAFLVLEGRDIGEKKRAQELKDQLFANVSHELRTPLTLILGRAGGLADDAGLPGTARESAERIRDNAHVLLHKVNDLLQVASLEGEGIGVSPEPVDVVSVAGWVAANFSSLAAERGLDLDVEVALPGADAAVVIDPGAEADERPQLPVVTDPDHLATVLVNLVANACRFAARRVVLAVRGDADEVALEVRDDGPGIPAEDRDRIFEPFHQLDRGPSRHHEGTGLGLSIVRQLTGLLEGDVAVDRAPEGGARFRARLPHRPAAADQVVAHAPAGGLADAQVAALAAERRLAATDVPVRTGEATPGATADGGRAPGRGRVLLVEDNRDLVRFLVEELAGVYDLEVAHDGLEALQLLGEVADADEDARVDVIVTDVMMPRLGGDELVRRLRDDDSLPQPPVLVLSAREDQQLREQLLAGGADDYLIKPFSPAELRARIENLLAPVRLQRELRRANAALERYAAQVSHDLKTPLATIIGFADTLLAQASHLDDADRRAMVERIAANGRRLEQLTAELLDDLRGAGETVAVELDEVLAEVEELLADRIHTEGATITAAPELPTVAAGRGAVRNVLLNLVENSLAYRHPDRPPVIEVRATTRDGWCEVAVVDNGLGIAPEDRDRVFRSGDRGGDVVKHQRHGTGLGLHGARKTVLRHGGEIWVDEPDGPGAVLRFTLPVAPDPGSA